MGAARGVLVTDDGLGGSDALTTAKVLAAAIGREPFDVVITAPESTDGYTGIVPQALAELLGVPAVTFASGVVSDGTALTVTRQAGRPRHRRRRPHGPAPAPRRAEVQAGLTGSGGAPSPQGEPQRSHAGRAVPSAVPRPDLAVIER
jgi:hypothetical protein